MGKIKDVALAVNGKKLPIALVLSLMGVGIGYGELKGKVAGNVDDIKTLKPITAQVARIEESVKGLKGDFTDFRKVQRKHNDKMDGKLERILEAVK